MAKVAPFHSSKNPGVYHVCSKCTSGNDIETKYKTSGKGAGRLCTKCAKLQKDRGC